MKLHQIFLCNATLVQKNRQCYTGPKKPAMPEQEAKRCILPLNVLAQQIICLQRVKDADFEFLKQIVTDPTTAEYGGFNTKMS